MSTNSLPSPNIIRIVIDLRLIDANLVIVIRGNAGIPGYSPFLPAINGHRCETADGCWYRSYYFHRFAPRRFRKTFICSIICYLFSGVHRFLPYRHRLCPAAGDRPARFQIENHCMVFRRQNLISPVRKTFSLNSSKPRTAAHSLCSTLAGIVPLILHLRFRTLWD